MPLRERRISAWILLGTAAVLTLVYSWLGSIGLWVFGGRITGMHDVGYLIQPLLAFPLCMLMLASVRWAAWGFGSISLLA